MQNKAFGSPHLCPSCHIRCFGWFLSPPSGSPRGLGTWSPHRAAPCRSYTPSLFQHTEEITLQVCLDTIKLGFLSAAVKINQFLLTALKWLQCQTEVIRGLLRSFYNSIWRIIACSVVMPCMTLKSTPEFLHHPPRTLSDSWKKKRIKIDAADLEILSFFFIPHVLLPCSDLAPILPTIRDGFGNLDSEHPYPQCNCVAYCTHHKPLWRLRPASGERPAQRHWSGHISYLENKRFLNTLTSVCVPVCSLVQPSAAHSSSGSSLKISCFTAPSQDYTSLLLGAAALWIDSTF